MMHRGLFATAFAVLFTPAPVSPEDAVQDGAATIKGRVIFEGVPPKEKPIDFKDDKFCGDKNKDGLTTEFFKIGAAGEMANVFVHVKSGFPGRKFEPPAEPVTLTQVDCRFIPRVFGIMIGQELKIHNGDETLHNIHAVPTLNAEFNIGQGRKDDVTIRKFTIPEVGIRIKCDVHGWMFSWAHVTAHPYHAVTGADGTFQIKDLPPGEYEIEAWHEKLKTRSEKVTLGGGETRELGFKFSKK